MDFVYSSTIFIFTIDSNLDGAFLKVSLSFDCGILTPYKNERICSEYGDWVIPFYEYIFFFLGFRLPFSAFEIEVRKHAVIAPS